MENSTTTTKKPRMMVKPTTSGFDTSETSHDAGLVPLSTELCIRDATQEEERNDDGQQNESQPKPDELTVEGRPTPNQNLALEGTRAGANSPDGADHSPAELVPAMDRIIEEMHKCQLED